MVETDLYSVLGLTPAATTAEIQAAHEQLIAAGNAGEMAPEQRAAIEEAFAALGDPIRRLRYDARLSAPPPPRFQLPSIALMPSRPAARVRTLKAGAAAIAVGAIAVSLLLLSRGKGKLPLPAQPASDLAGSSTATPSAVAPRAISNQPSTGPAFLLPANLQVTPSAAAAAPSAANILAQGGVAPPPPPASLAATPVPAPLLSEPGFPPQEATQPPPPPAAAGVPAIPQSGGAPGPRLDPNHIFVPASPMVGGGAVPTLVTNRFGGPPARGR